MWKFNGDVIPMIDNIQWSFVVEKMMHNDENRLMNIISNSDDMQKAAEEYGMTRMAVAKEMIRLGQEAILILKEQDKEQN